ncbi:MAG: mechanosensitive ion channel domain-containing protein [Pseudomonadota bacterium]
MINIQEILPKLQEVGLMYGFMLAKAIAIFVIGRWVAKIVANIIRGVMRKSNMDPMLRKFLYNIIYTLLLAFVVIATISALGIQTASLIAVLGAAGLAIGLALQGSLANFAAGVLMIVFRPYKLGDLVNVAGTEGFVEEVDVFTTVLRLPDKTKIIIPNGLIMAEQIVNYTDVKARRMELVVGIAYDDDIDKARDAILAGIAESEYVLDEPTPTVTVAELGDSSVNLAVRPWVDSQSYAPASHEITERIKKSLDAAGVTIPFPQRDVHLFADKGDVAGLVERS